MAQPVPRGVVEGFYGALANFDMQALAHYLDDEVIWTISGPVDVLPFCGQRAGKTVVLELLGRETDLLLEKRRLVPHSTLVDGDRVAVFGKLMATRRDVGCPISYRIAQFIRFENNKVVEYISIIDSFDAVEQVLGHQLVRKNDQQRAENGNVVAL
jgi:ketosteroid isomerase-like protein